MTQLHKLAGTGDAANGDVVFIHGLGGDALTTWGLDSQPSWTTWGSPRIDGISISGPSGTT